MSFLELKILIKRLRCSDVPHFWNLKMSAGKLVLTGKDLKDAKAQISQGNQSVVGLEFSDEAAKSLLILPHVT